MGIGRQLAHPGIGQVAVLFAERAIVFPAHSHVQREFRADFPVVLNERIHIRFAIGVDDASGLNRTARYTEQTLEDITRIVGVEKAGKKEKE